MQLSQVVHFSPQHCSPEGGQNKSTADSKVLQSFVEIHLERPQTAAGTFHCICCAFWRSNLSLKHALNTCVIERHIA